MTEDFLVGVQYCFKSLEAFGTSTEEEKNIILKKKMTYRSGVCTRAYKIYFSCENKVRKIDAKDFLGQNEEIREKRIPLSQPTSRTKETTRSSIDQN